MNILFITDTFPYPLDSGGKIVSYQLLTTLALKHSVHLICLSDIKPSIRNLQRMSSLGIKTDIVFSNKKMQPPKSEKIRYIKKLKPFYLYHYNDRALSRKVVRVLRDKSFDVIHIDHLYMSQYLPEKKNQLWILSEHNIEHKLHLDYLKTLKNTKRMKLYHAYDALTMWLYEKNTLKLFDQIIVLDQGDKKEVEELGVDPKKVIVSTPWQNIVSENYHRNTKEMLFVGNLWWKPNYDAMKWFIEEIFPRIREKIPNITLKIIGKDSFLLQPFARDNPSIKLLDRVANLKPHLKKAQVFILPFRIGEGIRIKALTAFACSLPVVATKKGVQGLQIKSKIHYLEAQTPSSFASQTETLLNHKTLQRSLVQNARQYLKIHHEVFTIQHKLLAKYAKVGQK